jgi:chemotaxis protein histidine kinase CheA
MNLEPAPRLPKWIFLAIDAGLLLIAFLIISFAKDPYAPLPFVSAVLCAALAAIIGLVPFLIDYAADTAEYVERERARMNDQGARLHASVESLARAAAQIKAVEEAVHKSAREAETLPYRMQEKLAEFNESLAAKEESDREALETELEQLRAANSDQLKAVAEKIAKAAADWTALEVATRKQLAATEAALAKLQAGTGEAATKLETQIASALKEIDARVAALRQAAATVPTSIAVATVPAAAATPERVTAPAVPAAAAETTLSPEPSAASESPAPADPAPTETPAENPSAAEPPKPKKPRAPRKPKPEETMLAMAESSPSATNGAAHAPTEAADQTLPAVLAEPAPARESVAPATPVSEESSGEATEPAASPAESSTSSDGATRLLATAYIGIGNKLFIRGDGPGLSWDHGVPMQFVSIGKWGWSTHDAAGPVRCKLYKNDETAALTGEIVLEAGRHTEVTAMF